MAQGGVVSLRHLLSVRTIKESKVELSIAALQPSIRSLDNPSPLIFHLTL